MLLAPHAGRAGRLYAQYRSTDPHFRPVERAAGHGSGRVAGRAAILPEAATGRQLFQERADAVEAVAYRMGAGRDQRTVGAARVDPPPQVAAVGSQAGLARLIHRL